MTIITIAIVVSTDHQQVPQSCFVASQNWRRSQRQSCLCSFYGEGDVKYDYDDVNDRQSCLCDDAKYDDEHDATSEEEDLTMYTMGKESPW